MTQHEQFFLQNTTIKGEIIIMEGIIKYVNPEQKYGYIQAEGEPDISFKMKPGKEYPLNAHVTFDLIVLENSRRYADNIVLQHTLKKHGKLKISNIYAPSKIEALIAENKESCAIVSELISKSRGTKETVFPFNDYAYLPTYYHSRPEYQWLIGKPSGYWINSNSLFYLKIKKLIRYQGTTQGNGSSVPKYGCDSLLLGKHVYKNICAFVKNAGIRPEFYHIAYLDGTNSVAIISLAQLNTLLEKGYNGITIGEYPGKRPDLPNRYMIPVTCFKEYH